MRMRALTRFVVITLLVTVAAGFMGCALPGRRGVDRISEEELPIMAEAIESVVRGEEDISFLHFAAGTAHHLDFGSSEGRDEVQAIMSKLDRGLPGVLNAVGARQRRYVTIQQYVANGCLGESKKGLLIGPHVHDQPCPDIEEDRYLDDRLAMLIIAENDDRRAIYEGIARYSALGGRTRKKVQRVFADTRRDHALPGTVIQLDSGEWVHKGQ